MKILSDRPICAGVEVVRWNKKNNKIKAIKRLSDGLIFSVGEYVNLGRITGFNLHNAHGEGWAYFHGEGFGKKIHTLAKLQPSIQTT